VFPWIPFLQNRGGRKLSDIEYLSIKDFGSKRVDKTTVVIVTDTTTETDIVTQTASSGKDMYLGEGIINFTENSLNQTVLVTLRLYINGTVIETIKYLAVPAQDTHTFNYKFLSKGKKVAATEIIKITTQHNVNTSNTSFTYGGTLILFEEVTGESPAIT